MQQKHSWESFLCNMHGQTTKQVKKVHKTAKNAERQARQLVTADVAVKSQTSTGSNEV